MTAFLLYYNEVEGTTRPKGKDEMEQDGCSAAFMT